MQASEQLSDGEEAWRPGSVAPSDHRQVGSDPGRLVARPAEQVQLAARSWPLQPSEVADLSKTGGPSTGRRAQRRAPIADVATGHRRLGQTEVHLRPKKILGPKGYDEHMVRDVSVRCAWQDRTHHMNQKLLVMLVKL